MNSRSIRFSTIRNQRFRSLLPGVMAASCMIWSENASSVDYSGKSVGRLQSFFDGADCFYFQLTGVSEADPVKQNDPWFAISRSQYGAKDAMATLLAAKASGATVRVVTRGTLTCGYAGVGAVELE